MQPADPTKFWDNRGFEGWPSFLEMMQVYIDNTATMLKSRAVVEHPVQAVFLNSRKNFERIFVHHSYTLIPLLPVSGALKDVNKDDSERARSRHITRFVLE